MSQNQASRSESSFSSRPRAAQPSARPTNRRPLWWKRARRGLAGGLLLGVAAFFLANLTASWLLHRELAAVVRRGEPLRLSKLVPPPLPDARNAASIYLRASQALILTKAEEAELRDGGGTVPSTDTLAKNQAALQLTRQAAALPACRFSIDYGATNMAGILLPHLGKMRRLAEFMRAQARWEAQTGQTEAALNDIAVLFRMSEHLAPEPILISGMTAIAIERIGYTTLAQVLPEVSLSPAQAHDFALRLGHTDWTATLRYDVRGERCFGLWAFQYVSNPLQASQLLTTASAPTANPIMKVLSILWSPLWKMDELHYLRAIDQRSEALRTPGTPLVSDDAFNREIPWYAVCTRVMLPALPAVGQRRDQVLVYRRMALTALALHAYRTTQGSYPPDLRAAETVWGAALPRDLYSDQPFFYRATGDTMQLYSIGPNRKDEGGAGGKAHVGDDLVWQAGRQGE